MKKVLFATIGFAFATAQAADYPQECIELEDLTQEAAEVMPEMKEQLDATGSEEERKEAARKAWAEMSESEQAQALAGCEQGAEMMKQIIEAAKAQK